MNKNLKKNEIPLYNSESIDFPPWFLTILIALIGYFSPDFML